MTDAQTPPSSGPALRAGLALTDLDLGQLWTAYVGLGGSLTAEQLGDALASRRALSGLEHDMVAHALNEYFLALGRDHPVAYAEELDAREPIVHDARLP
ncbi:MULTISPECIES: hypothetical protein [unclassified Pseudonocardia]|jgi:hypothetical protein|uniref:hypothetical protein n=1 Tax=unclassified Pseudonocardia TaxID=2619320 RepID=UPI0009600499|nr:MULTISPECIES: hypothetical protein [unclassified Pseudonocardia]MBN9102952.1 hypothetical protein [Pseudonocardia sp.]OJY39031.1 MAG: hypothetical protein BGP03_02155 [Pseudonocardia sp. 73-21]